MNTMGIELWRIVDRNEREGNVYASLKYFSDRALQVELDEVRSKEFMTPKDCAWLATLALEQARRITRYNQLASALLAYAGLRERT